MFSIQKKYQGENLKDENGIYSILENLYYLNTNKFNYGISIYDQLCKRINTEYLLKQLHEKCSKYQFKGKRIIIDDLEKSLLEINNCCIILYTNANISSFLKYINMSDANIFVCDFANADFFWLKKVIRTNLKINV